ncbi:MAG: InlB B-repeat-containing protein, partial [Mogibacterium sp.]|nr:InlB B-repeat-containing protein [Mogibacterium sp.]
MKKNSTFKRFLAFLLCAAMMITYMPSSVYTLAYEGDVAANEESDETPTQEKADLAEGESNETASETTKGSDNTAPEGNQTVTQPSDTNGGNSDTGDGSEQPAEGETPAVTGGGDDADAYPEQSFEKTLDGLTIKVAAEKGAFPAGTDMTIESADMEKVIAAIGQNEGAKAVKIAFQDKDGNAIEPAEAGKVSVTVDADNLEEGKTYKVFHLDNVNNATEATLSEEFKTDDLVFAVVGVEEEADTTAPAKAPTRAADGETAEDAENGESEESPEMITVTFDPTVVSSEPLMPITIEVAAGEKIGDQLPVIGEVPGYNTKWIIDGTQTVVTADTVVTEPFEAVVGKDKIVYTVTFLNEDGTTLKSVNVDIDGDFTVSDEDYPAVPEKTNQVGKWVYVGTENEFTVGTRVTENVTVEPFYEQNIFTVKFVVEADPEQNSELTTASGTTIILPSDPIIAGHTFSGWFTKPNGQGEEYTADSTVSKDLTLYAYFADQVRVSFIVKDKNGNVISEKSQYFVDLESGDELTNFPDDPFVEGEVFDYWKNETTNEKVESGYTVTESFNAVAVFKDIETYKLTVNYYYMNGSERVEVGTQVYDIVEEDFPFTVTAPGYTIASEITDDPTYYPSQPTITVNKDQFTKGEDGKYILTVEDEFVAADASYKVGHYLEPLSGSEYELIETVNKVGVKNSKVTPEINNYAYAEYDHRDENVTLTGDANQELKVYYTRRNFTLSYNVGGGDYIEAVTKKYGETITLPTTATRKGYTFAGWYKDSDCTESAGTSITLEDNTTLYAKWNPAQVEYKIVYMIENANDNDYSYLATVTKQAATGSSVTMTAQTAGAADTRPSELDTTNFTFKDSTTETILADGTTVVTVHYSRNVYTLQGRYNNGNVSGASLSAKYGADITSLWASTFGSGNNAQYSWSYNNQNDSKFKSLTIMPSLSVRTNTSPANTIYLYRHSDSASYYQHLEYWLQNYTGEGVTTTTYNGKTYGRVKSIDMRYNFLSDVDDWYEIEGYTKAGYTATASRTQNGTYSNFTYDWGSMFSDYHTGWWPNYTYTAVYTRFNFYYDAEEYPLTFYNHDGSLISTEQVTLGDDISAKLTSKVPAAPVEGATWLGWYTDQAHTSAYSGGTKMPAGLVLYAAFKLPNRTISYDSQGGTDVASETKEHGFYATMPENPTRENFEFLGWFTKADETGSPYDWNQPVTQDTKLYAHWAQKTIGYTVHYYEKGSTTSVLPDKVVSDPKYTEGTEVTETAPTVAGHVADEASKSIELSFDEENNVIVFYYDVIPNELEYTVNYVLKDNPDIKVAESKTVTVDGSTTNVLELAKEVDAAYFATQTDDADILGKHYKPTESSKELQLALENNVITFEYVPYTSTKITVNYLDMDGNSIHDTDVSFVEKGDTFTLMNKAPDGYVYHHAYLDGTTTAPEATYQITGNEGNLVINIYYQKKLIILANNKAKTYDGTALFSSFDVDTDYTVTGTLRGDTLTSLEFAGSQSDAGTSATTPKNAQISKGAQAITDPETYYSIIYVPGSLTVKPANVYISISADQWNTHSGTRDHNYYTGQVMNAGFTNPGKQHFNDNTSKSAYISITSGQRDLFKEKYGDAIWNALYGTNGALISEKDAGTYTYSGDQQRATVAGVEVDGQAMMSDPNYSITLYARDSFLTIEPLPLTITTPSADKPYDGTALTKSEGATLDHSYWTENIGGEWTAAETAAPGEVTLGTGEKITFKVTGTQTPVGTSDNTYSIEWGENKASNYKVSATLGTLEVTAGTISITVKDKESVYNGATQKGNTLPESITGTGKTLENEQYKVEGLANGQVLKITGYTEASGKDVNTYTNGSFEGATVTVMSGAGEDAVDVTENYSTINKTAGKLTITPATVTVTAENKTKVYGDADPTLTAKVEGLKGSDAESSIVYTLSRANGENVGEYTITPAGEAVQGNYNVVYKTGTLTITKAQVTVTAADKSKTYGDADPTLTATVTGLKNGDAESVISYTLSRAKGENVGEYTITPAGAAEQGNYNVVYETGTLTINKATVTVTADGKSKVYGDADPELTATVTGLKNGDAESAISYTLSRAEGENVGDYAITPAGDAVQGNYDVVYVPGTLTITKAKVTVTADNKTKKYGEGDPELTATVSGLKNGDAESVISYTLSRAEGENVGEYTITPAGEAVQGNYDIEYITGKLTITKATVTVTADNKTKTYGDADPELTATVTGLKNGDAESVISYTLSREKGENVGEYTITPAGDAVQGNYDVQYVTGKLTITKATATVTAGNKTKTYGDADPELSATVTGLKNGDAESVISYTLSRAEGENVGDYAITPAGDAVQGNYDVVYVPGTLTITKAALTVTAEDKSKVYGAEDPELTWTVDGLKNGDTKDILTVETGREEGEDVGHYEITPSGAAEIANYTIKYEEGDFEIKKAELTVTAEDKSKVYGAADPELTWTVEGLQNEDTKDILTVAIARESGENVGHYKITPSGAAEIANYTIKYEEGDFEITKAELTVKANDNGKVYGSEDPVLTSTVTGMQNGDTEEAVRELLNLSVTREEGENVGDYVITASGAEALDNYTVKYEPGIFKITPLDVTVTITGHQSTLPYDGEEHSVEGYDVEISNPLYTKDDFSFDGTAKASQTTVGTAYMGLAKEQFTNKNTNFGTVTFNVTDGYQAITPVDKVVVTITGNHSTLPYDGEEHSVSGYEVSISNPLYKESDFTFTPSESADLDDDNVITARRTDAGTTNMGLAAGQFANKNSNFKEVEFVVTDGYQTITPIDVAVTIKGHTSTVPYDGTEHSVSGYDVEIGNPLYKEADFTFSGTAAASRTRVVEGSDTDGQTDMGLTAAQFTNNNANFANVTFNVTDGYQKITPIEATVTITGHKNTSDYDGKEHSVSGYDVSFSTPLYTEADFTFSGTAAASRTDAGTTDMELSEEQFANTNTNFSKVTFNVTDGYQKIDPIDVTVIIKGHTSTVPYDGEAHTASGYDVTIENPLYKQTDFTFTGTATATRTNVVEGEDADGQTDMGLNAAQFTNNNTNFKTVTFNVVDGYQKITPIKTEVEIVGNNSTVPYDGEAHTVNGYVATAKNALYNVETDIEFSGEAKATRTNVVEGEDADGQTDMGLTEDQFSNKNPNFSEVTFKVTDGYQKITPINAKVTIVGAYHTDVYDGAEHKVEGYTATADNAL